MTGDKKVDLEKLKKVRGDDSLRMADKGEVSNTTGFAVGTVSPFGLRKVDVIADQAVQTLSSLIMGSGKEDTLIKMTASEFAKSFKGSFVPVAL
jgi:prolyl-tRNA editing enzyme YbaK/EbsC (Cys-tRNA(Pro) deacylase)